MTVAPEVTAADVAVSTTGNVTISRPRQPAATVGHCRKISAKAAAHVVAAAAMWLIVIALITVV
jgi:hypothetical protein